MNEESKIAASKMSDQADVVIDIIRPVLAGLGPQIQGAVVGDLFAVYLHGHAKEIREDVMQVWLAMVRDLVALYDDENSKKNSKKN